MIFRIFEPFRAFVLFAFNCSACFRCIITKQQTLLMIIFSTNYSTYRERATPLPALNNNIEILEYQFELVISVEIAFILYLTVILIFISLSLSLPSFPSVDDVSCVCFDVIQLCKDDATAASVAILVPIIVVIVVVGLSVFLCLFFAHLDASLQLSRWTVGPQGQRE